MRDEEIRKRLGLRIKVLRQQKGWRQEDVQEAAAFSSRYLGRIERGTANVTLSTLIRLCEILDVELPALFAFLETGRDVSEERERIIAKVQSILKGENAEELRKLRVFLEEIL